MNRLLRIANARGPSLLAVLGALAFSGPISAQSKTYTLDADFDEGVLSSVNHTAVHDQLQLDVLPSNVSLPFVAFAISGRGTIVRVDANSGVVLGEYRTAPNLPVRMRSNPSRTAVDSLGNVWVGNRDEQTGGKGSVMKLGVTLGGTRVDANGTPNPLGEYLKPPFSYNTCIDRDGDGLIHTSNGLHNVLDWVNITDGAGGADGIVQDAQDECILVFQRTTGIQIHHVSVDSHDNVWVGGYPFFQPTTFDQLDGNTGAILSTFSTPCGGFGGIVDNAGVLWSTSLAESSVLRYDTNTSGPAVCVTGPGINDPHGLQVDTNGFIWVAQFDFNNVTKISPTGVPVGTFRSGGASFDRAVAITPIDNDVWICNSGIAPSDSGGHDISRLDNNGVLRKVIDLGANGIGPRGISVDSNGKVWVSNSESDNGMRIDPNGDSDGLGKVDLTVDLGAGAFPFNMSNMTGMISGATSQPNGTWQVVYDSGAQNTPFGTISYNASVPANTSLIIEYRASNSLATLATLPFQPVNNGVPFSGVFAQFVEVRATFMRANPQITASPELFDLTIEALAQPPVEECTSGLRNPGSLLVFPEFDNRTGVVTVLTVTNTALDGEDIKAEFVYIQRVGLQGQSLDCLEYNRTEKLTPNDTLTVLTLLHNPNASQGYVYVFAKDRLTGQAIVHNHLIGNAMVLNGFQSVQYSHNPFSFLGIGADGTPTDHDGDGIRDLNNIEYSCAPDEILVPRFLGQDLSVDSQLVLLNLTGGTAFTATINLLIYNDNEEEFSSQTSFQCWAKRRLVDISGVFGNFFLLNSTNNDPNEGTSAGAWESGWFRMDGLSASSFATTIPDPAFLAVLVEGFAGHAASDLPFELGGQTNGDLLPHGVLGDSSP